MGKYGLIMPICTMHEMQVESWTAARAMSRPETPFIAMFNGTPPVPLPDGIEVVHQADRFSDECDLWQWCLETAIERGWDWCMVIHDDFLMREPGWEDQLDEAEGWKVALASWCVYESWDEQANSGAYLGRTNEIPAHHLGVVIDSFSFGFKVDLFRQRGCVAETRFGFGYGAWDSNAWALQNGYGLWRIMLDSWHHWLPTNTRDKLRVGAAGHPEIGATWRGIVLPSHVHDVETIEVVGKRIKVSPDGWAPKPGCGRSVECRIDYENRFVTDTDTGQSVRLRDVP